MTLDPSAGLPPIDRFPRSAKYDAEWVIANEMGPHVLWLTEFLCEAMDIRAGMKVLDLGCGKALSSIFLAREFDVQVWAADLWVPALDNLERIREADLQDQVIPVNADARDLPFTDEAFDAIVSVDAFEYFGTHAPFLSSLVRVLKPEQQIGVVNAGVNEEVEVLPKEWPADFSNFHTAEWWRDLWSKTGSVEVEVAEPMPDGRDLWLLWNKALGVTDDDWLTSLAGENLGFHRLVARRVSRQR